MLPETGGYFVFSRRAFGDAVGFTVGWTDWIGQSSAIAYASIAFGRVRWHRCFPHSRAARRIIGVPSSPTFGVLQWTGSAIQQPCAADHQPDKGAGVSALWSPRASGSAEGKSRRRHHPERNRCSSRLFWPCRRSFSPTTAGTEALYFTEEIKDPVRQLPRSMIGGVAIVIVIYVLVNAALVYVLPLARTGRIEASRGRCRATSVRSIERKLLTIALADFACPR